MKDIEKRTGISTACFYPMLLEDAFDVICDNLKYKVCELFLNTQSEADVRFLRDIKSKADDNGVRIVAVHPYLSGYEPMLFFTEYKRRTSESIKLYGMFFEAAQFLGADYAIFHGLGPSKLKIPVEEYAEIFMSINEEAKKFSVELLHENVGEINNHIKDLIQANPEIRFTLDFKHSVVNGSDVVDIIEVMGENLAHIHVNDMRMQYPKGSKDDISKTKMCRLPFYGNLDFSGIFKKLEDINYIGSFITEVYRYNYADEAEITESKKRFADFLGKL
jgi:sugar phosphate isomerase/epimerase